MTKLLSLLFLKFVPAKWLTVGSAWVLAGSAVACALPGDVPYVDCGVVAGLAGGSGLIGIRRAILNATGK